MEYGHCQAKQETMAETLGLSRRTIIRAIQKLEDVGYLKYRKRGKLNIYNTKPVSIILETEEEERVINCHIRKRIYRHRGIYQRFKRIKESS
jgi:DNA-binding transcriptional MocR family regulator